MSDKSRQRSVDEPGENEPLPRDLEQAARALRSEATPVVAPSDSLRAPVGDEEPVPETLEFATHVHQYVREYIQFADQKAAFVFGAAVAFLVYEFERDLHQHWLKAPSDWSIAGALTFVSMALTFSSAVLAATVVLPRLSRSHDGPVFFGSISSFKSAAEYASATVQGNAGSFTRDLLWHTYDLSKVCSKKYARLGWGLWLGAIGIALGVLALLR